MQQQKLEWPHQEDHHPTKQKGTNNIQENKTKQNNHKGLKKFRRTTTFCHPMCHSLVLPWIQLNQAFAILVVACKISWTTKKVNKNPCSLIQVTLMFQKTRPLSIWIKSNISYVHDYPFPQPAHSLFLFHFEYDLY